MDVSTSSSRSSSQDNIFSQVQSPLPIRNIVIHRNKLLPSFAFLDLFDESQEDSNGSERLSLQKLRAYNSEGWIPKENHTFAEDEHHEAERENLVWRRCSLQSSVNDIRPPSRAHNPLVHDETFLRMNKGLVHKNVRSNGPAMVHKLEINEIELTEHA